MSQKSYPVDHQLLDCMHTQDLKTLSKKWQMKFNVNKCSIL